MNIYLVSRTGRVDYDEYEAIVVVAKNEEQARNIMPTGETNFIRLSYSWVRTPDDLDVELIGKAKSGYKPGVILASYIAG